MGTYGAQEFTAALGKEGTGLATNHGLVVEPVLSVGKAQSDSSRFLDSILSKHSL